MASCLRAHINIEDDQFPRTHITLLVTPPPWNSKPLAYMGICNSISIPHIKHTRTHTHKQINNRIKDIQVLTWLSAVGPPTLPGILHKEHNHDRPLQQKNNSASHLHLSGSSCTS